MTAMQIKEAAERNLSSGTAVVSSPVQAVQTAQEAVKVTGEVLIPPLTQQEIQDRLGQVHGASGQDGTEDGTRVHIQYKAFGTPTPEAIRCASRAVELGLPRDRYTGRVHRVFTSSAGDQCICLWVELERDHMYRTLNLKRGEVRRFVVLGD